MIVLRPSGWGLCPTFMDMMWYIKGFFVGSYRVVSLRIVLCIIGVGNLLKELVHSARALDMPDLSFSFIVLQRTFLCIRFIVRFCNWAEQCDFEYWCRYTCNQLWLKRMMSKVSTFYHPRVRSFIFSLRSSGNIWVLANTMHPAPCGFRLFLRSVPVESWLCLLHQEGDAFRFCDLHVYFLLSIVQFRER